MFFSGNQTDNRPFWRERRSRNRAPRLIKTIALFFLLIPLLNTVSHMLLQNASFLEILAEYPWQSYVLMAAAVVTGFGILVMARWGYYVFYACTGLFLLYNVVTVVEAPSYHSLGLLVASTILVYFAFLFTKDDMRAPFLHLGRRGFRLAPRTPTEVNVMVNDHKFITRDISATGLRVHWPGCEQEEGDEVEVSFLLHSKPIHMVGGIARIQQDDVSIAFRSLRTEPT